MTAICENCGAQIIDGAKFCQECGSEIKRDNPPEKEEIKFCENCGNELAQNEAFCSQCGANIHDPKPARNPEPQQKSFIEENKLPIAIVGIVAIAVLVLLLAVAIPTEDDYYDYDVGTQTVEVGGIQFEIPGDYRLVPMSIDYGYENYVSSYSQTYANYDENITITVMYSPGVDVDANEVNDQTGGVKKELCGYTGYYNELSDGYLFSFGKGNKLCMILVSSPYVFDGIKVLG